MRFIFQNCPSCDLHTFCISLQCLYPIGKKKTDKIYEVCLKNVQPTSVSRQLKFEYINEHTPSLILPCVISVTRNLKAGRCSRRVIVKVINCRIVVSEFKLQSRYYVHFWTNTLGKDSYLLIPLLWVKKYH